MKRVLYQFPISHYCEKVRWVLDHKGLDYRVYNQLPGPHVFINRWRSGSPTVPLLVEEGKAIGGSHMIALHLEAAGGRTLLPKSPAARRLLDETVRYFDDVVGPAVRRYAYGFITARAQTFDEVFFGEYTGIARTIGRRVLAPIVRPAIGRMYDVRSPSARELPDVIRTAADRVEARLAGGASYLLEDTLTLADITVASLFAPMTGPPGSPWAFDLAIPELQSLRAELSARPIGVYIRERYATRHVPVER
jgi:glutathione S-transferase